VVLISFLFPLHHFFTASLPHYLTALVEDVSTMSSIPTTTHIITEKPPKFLKQGVLYKQRNHFKGWRSRWFALDEQFLHYYLEKEDMASRNSIQIGESCLALQ
jgi:hypothetical protein